MKIRYYSQEGQEICKDEASPYKYCKNIKENRPQDFVIIKQLESQEILIDPYGQEQEVAKLSDPVEEVYCGWVWENECWNCLVRMVVRKQEVILDRRPSWWKFFEKFNENRPRFV